MTDPHPIFNFPTVNASDSTESALTSPAISISSASNGRYETSNPPHVPADASGTNTAYATNPPPEPDSTFFNHSSGHPSIVIQDPQNLQYLAQDAITTTTATTIPTQSRSASLFGSFGSQTWQPPPGPYLDFAPQPVYEPTGELANEHVQSFPEFDSPSSIRSSASQPLGGGATGTITSPQAAVNLNGNSGSATLFIQPPLPKSVLKRKAEHDLTSSTDIGTSKGQQSLESGGPKRRSVSFERMSAPTSRSPGDVSSVPPELQTGQRTSHSGPASAARGRARQSSSSTTPRAGAHVPSGGVPAQSRPGRSSRVPSATPPSILPPEKVFPIQVGSDLFRLSGASISSDGKCHPSLSCVAPEGLTRVQLHPILPNFLRNSSARTKKVAVSGRCTSTATHPPSEMWLAICKVSLSAPRDVR